MSSATDRTGLYIMTIVILISTCSTRTKVDKLQATIEALQTVVVSSEEGPLMPDWVRRFRLAEEEEESDANWEGWRVY